MKNRSIVTFALGILVVGLLAGCAASPKPAPTASVAAGCSPSAAVISWSPADGSLSQPVVAQLRVDDNTSGNLTSSSMSIPTPAEVSFAGQSASTPTGADTQTWNKAVLASLRRTGQVPTDFGGTLSLPALGVEPLTGSHARIAVVQVLETTSVHFNAKCTNSNLSGVVTGPNDSYSISTIVVGCDQATKDSDSADVKAALAAAATYCPAA